MSRSDGARGIDDSGPVRRRGGPGVFTRLKRRVAALTSGRSMEYLTFGRRPRMLFRVWAIQVVLLLADVGVFSAVHPFFLGVFRPAAVQEVYVALTGGFLAVLWWFLSKMGRLTFAPRFHRPRTLALSALGYLALGGSTVALALAGLDMTPAPGSQSLLLDLSLAAMLTTGLGALLAIAFYAQFSGTGFPRRRHTRQVVGEWLASLDWAAEPEGSTTKDRRYVEFANRTAQVADLLDGALTEEGQALREEFHDWREEFERYSLLTRERIIEGDVRNSELRAQHEQFESLRRRLAFVADVPREAPYTTNDSDR